MSSVLHQMLDNDLAAPLWFVHNLAAFIGILRNLVPHFLFVVSVDPHDDKVYRFVLSDTKRDVVDDGPCVVRDGLPAIHHGVE